MKKLTALCLSVIMLFGLCPAALADEAEKPGTEEESGFSHPGILQSGAELERISEAVRNGAEPYKSAFEALKESEYAQSGVQAQALETVIRGGNGDNCAKCYRDIQRAFQCAIIWKIEGDSAYGDTARDILNAWSETLKEVSGNADRYLAAGLYGYQIANASELMRDYPGFEKERMQKLLLNVFYKPLSERFLFSNEYGRDHNDAYIENYWANWDLANMASGIAIAVFCDRRDIYDKMMWYYRYGAGNGSIYNFAPRLYEDALAQWQESGRDQGHTQLGVGLAASICETAWNQGDDLYGWANNRFMYAAEYVAKYNNGASVPFTEYKWGTGQKGTIQSHTVISDSGRGEYRAIWEMIYNHYAKRKGFYVPNIAARAELMRPEGGPGGHATTFDQPGYGTLLYTREENVTECGDIEPNIKNGEYKIVSCLSQKFLTASDGALCQYADGAVNEEDQTFTLTHIGGGEYAVTVGDYAITARDVSYDDGAAVVLEKYEGKINQRLAFIEQGDGSYMMIFAHSTKPLDVTGASTADGAPVCQYKKNRGSLNQVWILEPVSAEETGEMKIVVNGKTLELDAKPKITEGRTLVPMRAIFEALGKTVTWDGETLTAFVGDEIKFTVGSNKAYVKGEEKELDVCPTLENGRTLVPLRFVAQNLGYDVKYDDLNKTVIVQDIGLNH